MLTVGAHPAAARTYESAGLTLSTYSPPPGGSVVATAAGYQPGSTATVDIQSTPTELGTGVANANGIATVTVTIPPNLAAGSHHVIKVTGVDPQGRPLVETANITLAAELSSGSVHLASSSGDPSAGSLAFTGTEIAGSVAGGLGLVGVGTLVALAARRRQRGEQ